MEYQEGNVIIDGIKIHYYRSGGKKPPIVLLHGATDDGLCWGRTAQELAEQYDVIMPEAQALAKKMATAWANFARTGNPNQPGLTWEPFDPTRCQTMVFDNSCRMVDDPEAEVRKILLA